MKFRKSTLAVLSAAALLGAGLAANASAYAQTEVLPTTLTNLQVFYEDPTKDKVIGTLLVDIPDAEDGAQVKHLFRVPDGSIVVEDPSSGFPLCRTKTDSDGNFTCTASKSEDRDYLVLFLGGDFYKRSIGTALPDSTGG